MLPLRTPVNCQCIAKGKCAARTHARVGVKQAVAASVCCLPVNRDATGDMFIPTGRRKQLETPDRRIEKKQQQINKQINKKTHLAGFSAVCLKGGRHLATRDDKQFSGSDGVLTSVYVFDARRKRKDERWRKSGKRCTV